MTSHLNLNSPPHAAVCFQAKLSEHNHDDSEVDIQQCATVRGNRVVFWWKSAENRRIIASNLLIDPAKIYVAGSLKLKMFTVRSIHQYQ